MIPVPYNMYKTRVLEALQTIFSPMYRNVWEQHWNNCAFATMTCPYYFCDFEDGLYEVYVPTVVGGDNRMRYWRIVVQVYDEVDKETIERNQRVLTNPSIIPVGKVDSETICHLSRSTTKEHRYKLRCLWNQGGRRAWFKGLLKGFKHSNKRGYFTPIIVYESPDIAVKRLLSLLVNFIRKRIEAFFKKLKLQPWMFSQYLQKKRDEALILILIERYSYTIRSITNSLLDTFDWLKNRLKDIYAEIGRQNVQKTKIQPLIKELKQIINVYKRENSLRNRDVPDPPILRRLVMVLG